MSALEPDAPATHIWPHWREAVRAWHAGRRGRHLGRAALGDVRGKGPSTGDLLRVGQVFVQLGLLGTSGSLTRHGQMVVDVAMGAMPRNASDLDGGRGLDLLVGRLERHMRRHRIVAPPTPKLITKRWRFRLADGSEASHAYIAEKS